MLNSTAYPSSGAVLSKVSKMMSTGRSGAAGRVQPRTTDGAVGSAATDHGVAMARAGPLAGSTSRMQRTGGPPCHACGRDSLILSRTTGPDFCNSQLVSGRAGQTFFG